MRQSQLFTKTRREAPKDEAAVNARLLTRGGFIFKNSAGIYTFLPLGLRVLEKIEKIIVQELNALGAQKILMQAMVDKKYMEPTARWDLDVGFFALDDKPRRQGVGAPTKASEEANFVLGWTHEEVLTAIAAEYISSYKDLPFAAYQIQTKFRNEPRAKSGLLRGKEFMMKDLYSFHADDRDLQRYYGEVKEAYLRIFKRCGLDAIYTTAAGGMFTTGNTHEFQVLSDVGEDMILMCLKCNYAENREISELKDVPSPRQGEAGIPAIESGLGTDKCPKCGGNVAEKHSIEVGNIFPLGTKYSAALGLEYVDELGVKQPVVMGSYGIGISRLMGAIAEISNDANGIIWPDSVSPFKVHLIVLDDRKEEAEKLYNELTDQGVEVLYDDRSDKTAGEKFADADLIGCPVRVVVSNKTVDKNGAEIKRRNEKELKLVKLSDVIKAVSG